MCNKHESKINEESARYKVSWWVLHRRVLLTHLVWLFKSRRKVVSYASHGLQWRFIEVRRFSINHLDHHDAQRPDVHLPQQQNKTTQSSTSRRRLSACPRLECDKHSEIRIMPHTLISSKCLSNIFVFFRREHVCTCMGHIHSFGVRWRWTSSTATRPHSIHSDTHVEEKTCPF